MTKTVYNKTINDICQNTKEVKNMHRRDGTGPLVMGPLTGRGMGPCGRGYFPYRPIYGQGRGYGRGYCGYYRPYPYESYPLDKKVERAFIEEKAILEARLKHINKLLDELSSEEE